MYTSSSVRFSPNSYSPETRKLPKNWEVRFSRRIDIGRPYYVNLETKKSQWNFPGEENQLSSIPSHRSNIPERIFSQEEIIDLNRLQDAQHRTR
jgi:hypothetical protein